MEVLNPNSKFVKVRCKCKNEQIIFDKASGVVKCVVCGENLTKSTGGKAIILAKVVEELK